MNVVTPNTSERPTNEYVEVANKLQAVDILQTVNGETVVVEFVEHVLLESSVTLYNFEVDGNHNYYVADSVHADTSEFVLVHNKGCKEVGGYKDGTIMTEDEVLNAAEEFLGEGYKEFEKGRFLSYDGVRQVRMDFDDLLGLHSTGPHVNFEIVKLKHVKIHIFLKGD